MRISDWSSDVCSSDLIAEVQRRVGDGAAALAMPVLADQVAAPAAGDRHVQVHAVGPVDVDVGAVVAVQTLGCDAGHRERGLEAAHFQPQPVVRRLVAESSDEYTSELLSLMLLSYAVFSLNK